MFVDGVPQMVQRDRRACSSECHACFPEMVKVKIIKVSNEVLRSLSDEMRERFRCSNESFDCELQCQKFRMLGEKICDVFRTF